MRPDAITKRAIFTINIKLRKFENSRDATRDEYIDAITKVFAKKIHKPSSNGKHCIIKFLLPKKENGKVKYLYGKLAQFTYFANKSWFDIDTLDVDSQFALRDGLIRFR